MTVHVHCHSVRMGQKKNVVRLITCVGRMFVCFSWLKNRKYRIWPLEGSKYRVARCGIYAFFSPCSGAVPALHGWTACFILGVSTTFILAWSTNPSENHIPLRSSGGLFCVGACWGHEQSFFKTVVVPERSCVGRIAGSVKYISAVLSFRALSHWGGVGSKALLL